MKFSVERSDMAKALSTVGRAVSSRTTIPIFECILITTENEKITIKSSDTEMYVITSIPSHISRAGKVLIPYRSLNDLVNKYNDSTIYFELDENNRLNIICGQSEGFILCKDADEYPDITAVSLDEFTPVLLDDFKSIIRETTFACAPEISINPVLTGVNLEYEDNKVTFTALDGYKMASKNINVGKAAEESKNIIIPGRMLNEILKIVSNYQDDPRFSISSNKFIVEVENTQIQCSLLNGPYIKYKSLIPIEINTFVNCNKENLLKSIERASVITDESHNSLIKMDFKDEEVTITSNSDIGGITELVNIDKRGNDLKIAFNAKYVLDILKNIHDERIEMEFRDKSGPCIIKPVDNNNYLYLIMPVRYSE